MTVTDQLAEFIKNSDGRYTNTLWLADDVMQVYVRKGFHSIYQGKVTAVTLDVASVVVNELHQRKGVWTKFIEKAHEINPWEATYIECVHNPILATSLLKRGWFTAPGLVPESYFMPKDMAKYYDQLFKQKHFPNDTK